MKIFDSVFKIVVVRADASESESEAVRDGGFSVAWMAACPV